MCAHVLSLPRSPWRWWLAVVVCWTGIAQSAAALDVVEVRWGFDGKVLRHRFNLLSVLVNNPRPEAFEGELHLLKHMSGGQRIDAPVVEPVYVGPFGQKWVQFHPYVGSDWETWNLAIRSKGRGETLELTSPRTGWPARVLIETGQGAARRTTSISRLPDNLFPPFVTATDGLQAVFLDGVPNNWDEPRRQAFLDWLYRGGAVFVLQGSGGSQPTFPASLGMLNGPLELETYGAGRIYRVARTRFDLTPEVLTELYRALPKRLVVDHQGQTTEIPAVDVDDNQAEPQTRRYGDAGDPLSSTSFLTRLKQMTRPKHSWPLLHLLFWLYIGLVFPGCFLLGRRWSDYRVVYASLLATVALFSVLFAVVGRRGYGEATAVHAVAIARPLPDGQLDVTQWSNAFVTSGGDYAIQHAGTGAIYATCNVAEAVAGAIRNGADAEFVADIPPFSSREFAHRIKLAAATPTLKLERCQVDGGQLRGLSIALDGSFPQQAESLLALYGDRFYTLNRVARPESGDRLEFGAGVGSVTGYLRVENFQSWQYQYGPGWTQTDRPTIDQFRELFTPLVSRSLNIGRQGDAEAFQLPPHVVRVFFAAPMSDAFFARNPYLGRQEGWVLYAVDLPVEPTP